MDFKHDKTSKLECEFSEHVDQSGHLIDRKRSGSVIECLNETKRPRV